MNQAGLKSIAIFLAALVGLCAAPAVAATEVMLQDGALRGANNDGVFSFKGIPYAAPPIGELRWAPPSPVKPWKNMRKATSYGNACIQKPGLSADNGGDPGPLSEDCLYLNVWTPTLDEDAKLPVIVWIHGGAFVFGAGGLDGYDGTPSARKGVVFVNLNYRLGALGFFAHPSLTEGAYNFGLLDQVAALEWVQKNIAKFGGDPANVTIMGQSAGSKSVIAHVASNRSRGLFAKAVAMSLYIFPDAPLEKAQEVAANIASNVGLDGANATLADLRAIPARRFPEIDDPDAALGPVPIVGGIMLTQPVIKTFDKHDEAPVPLIIGNTSDDASVISAFGFDPAAIVKKLGAGGIGLKILYPKMSDDERGRQALRDVVFTMNSRWAVSRHSKIASGYRYYFDYVAENDRTALPNGAPHGYDVAFFLDTLPLADGIKDRYTQADLKFAAHTSGYLIEFAKSGTPAYRNSPQWDIHKKSHDRTMLFGPADVELKKNFMRHRINGLVNVTRILSTIF